MNKARVAGSLVIALFAGSSLAQPPTYRVEFLRPIEPFPSWFGGGWGIRAFNTGAGDVGCTAFGLAIRPVRWNGTTPVELAMPDGWDSGEAAAINHSGLIAGTVYILAPEYKHPRAVEWITGRVRELAAPAGWMTSAAAVNDAGTIVGSGGTFTISNAIMWTSAGPTILPPLPGHDSAVATSINNAGDVAGLSFDSGQASITQRPVIWHNGTPAPLPVPVQTTMAGAVGINNRGDAIGWWIDESTFSYWNALLWRNGQIVADPDLIQPGLQLYGLNNSGDAVGLIDQPDDIRGVLYYDGALYQFTDLLAPGFHVVITEASVIADDGRISAWADVNGFGTPVLLTPVSPPQHRTAATPGRLR